MLVERLRRDVAGVSAAPRKREPRARCMATARDTAGPWRRGGVGAGELLIAKVLAVPPARGVDDFGIAGEEHRAVGDRCRVRERVRERYWMVGIDPCRRQDTLLA